MNAGSFIATSSGRRELLFDRGAEIRRRSVAVAAAIAFHGLVAGVFLVVTIHWSKPPAEQAISLVDLDMPPPPPSQTQPPPAAAPPKVEELPTKATPAEKPAPQAPAAVSAPAPPSEPDYLPQYQITKTPGIADSQVLSRIVYPQVAALAGLEDRVILDLYIDDHGTIRKVVVLKDENPGHGFAEAAVSAVEGLVVAPAEADGKPVAVRFRYPIRFTLK